MTDRARVIGALIEEWRALDDLLSGLDDAAWSTATPLPGWSVQDVVAHVIGTEAALSGEPAPEPVPDSEPPAHVRNDIGALNERWVASLRSSSPAEVLGRFREVTRHRTAVLEAMGDEEFAAPSWTPVGQATYGRFMEIRVFDCWLHEQDIRDGLGLPGHGDGACAELSIDEIVRALGYLVGKRAGAPDGSSVTIELTGPVRRTVHVAVDGRAAVVEALSGPATATIRLPSDVFVRLAGNRVEPDSVLGEVSFAGDAELGRRVATSLGFTI